MTDDDFQIFKADWYQLCVCKACEYPTFSVGHIFWWSLRDELSTDFCIVQWATDPEQAFKDWAAYFDEKWEDLQRRVAK